MLFSPFLWAGAGAVWLFKRVQLFLWKWFSYCKYMYSVGAKLWLHFRVKDCTERGKKVKNRKMLQAGRRSQCKTDYIWQTILFGLESAFEKGGRVQRCIQKKSKKKNHTTGFCFAPITRQTFFLIVAAVSLQGSYAKPLRYVKITSMFSFSRDKRDSWSQQLRLLKPFF